MRVKCLAQEHNTMSPARARTRSARSGVERANHEATVPPNRTVHDLKLNCTRALFLVTGKFYSVAQALTKAPRQPASLKCNFLIGWKNDVI